MTNALNKQKQTARRRRVRARARITGTSARPRLSVFRSNRGVYLQLIDDTAGITLVSVNMKAIQAKGSKTEQSAAAGTLLAQNAKTKGITSAVFDRGGNRYHGRIKQVAEAARAAGLKI